MDMVLLISVNESGAHIARHGNAAKLYETVAIRCRSSMSQIACMEYLNCLSKHFGKSRKMHAKCFPQLFGSGKEMPIVVERMLELSRRTCTDVCVFVFSLPILQNKSS
jgi:hypothetical protein